MCRFALEAAARKSEVAGLRLGDVNFHDPENVGQNARTLPWQAIGDKVRITLIHGTKGRRSNPFDTSDQGPARTIFIPVDLARELILYRDKWRLRSAWIYQKKHKRLPDRPDDKFFLSDAVGEPVSSDTFYRAWKVAPLPMPGWHPHDARHYWACTSLLAHLEREAVRAASARLEAMPDAWIVETGRSFVATVIRSQLGHASVETTSKYLEWVSAQLLLGEYYAGYRDDLEGHHEQI
jgi:integrase